MDRIVRLIGVVIITFSLSIVVIFAGHGMGVIGLMLFADPWHGEALLMWLPILCGMVWSMFPGGKLSKQTGLVILAGYGAVWLLFVSMSEYLPVTLATSIPFFLACCIGPGSVLKLPHAKDDGAGRSG